MKSTPDRARVPQGATEDAPKVPCGGAIGRVRWGLLVREAARTDVRCGRLLVQTADYLCRTPPLCKARKLTRIVPTDKSGLATAHHTRETNATPDKSGVTRREPTRTGSGERNRKGERAH